MAVGVLAIDKLKMDEAFASNIHSPFNECWTIRMDKELMVVDDDTLKYSHFSNDINEEQKALMVINNNYKVIILLSIDNKLISGLEGGIADCAIFDDEQFRFVEFKTNALGNSEKAVRDTFDKATSQLIATYQLFTNRLDDVGIQFNDAVTISCHIVVSHSFPKSKAVKQEYQLAFADEHCMELNFSEKVYW